MLPADEIGSPPPFETHGRWEAAERPLARSLQPITSGRGQQSETYVSKRRSLQALVVRAEGVRLAWPAA